MQAFDLHGELGLELADVYVSSRACPFYSRTSLYRSPNAQQKLAGVEIAFVYCRLRFVAGQLDR